MSATAPTRSPPAKCPLRTKVRRSYPLLALLARYAAGPARDELLAVAPEEAHFDLGRSPTTRLALATWARRNLPLSDRWLREVSNPDGPA